MTPIQQLMLGAGGKKKVYVDDVFKTHLYTGNGGAHQIVNGIDNTEESMIWMKSRDADGHPQIHDTIRGGTNYLLTNSNGAAGTDNGYHINTFNNNGFTLQNGGGGTNANGTTYASWNFKSAPGFFDIVQYTGSGSTQQIAHNLEAIPGCYMIKNTSNGGSWMVYHRQLNNGVSAAHYRLMLDGTSTESNDNVFGDTAPTATHFTAGGSHQETNQSGHSYVCYLFAGGESTGTGASSVAYGGASINDYSYFVDHDDFNVGTNFTAECWFKADSIPSGTTYNVIMGQWFTSNAWVIEYVGTTLRFYYGSSSNYKDLGTTSGAACLGEWHHVAFSKQGTTTRIFLDGVQVVADFDMGTQTSGSTFTIGGHASGNTPINGCFDGLISNVRVVKDTAVYTSSFRVPTAPLTGIANTVILCCNDVTWARGTTVNTTGDYMMSGTGQSSPGVRTDSPFDDPGGFVFGGKENIVKCGRYIGINAVKEINLGWQPQWLMVKSNSGGGDNWIILDSARGIVSHTGESNDNALYPNSNTSESTAGYLDLTPTGFRTTTYSNLNNDGRGFIYVAIRASDGYVGKPADVGTDVFNIIAGTSGSNPTFVSGFPVDFVYQRKPNQLQDWYTGARLTGKYNMRLNSTAEEESSASSATWRFDYPNGWHTYNQDQTGNQSWMWKRSAGLDVVTYDGNSTAGRQISHSLAGTPEMMWVKIRDHIDGWYVYHKDLNGGTNPQNYYLRINNSSMEAATANFWNNTAPNSTHFTVGQDGGINNNGRTYLAILFRSIPGISKVGTYSGSGSTVQTVNCGFQPRFVIWKNNSRDGEAWYTLDTLRGWGSGQDKNLRLNHTAIQTDHNFGEPTSTGFTMSGDYTSYNKSGDEYIFYAHA